MDPATRAAVRAEEQAILLRALAADPWRQVRAALANGAVQLGQLGLDDLVLGRGAMVTPDDYTFVYLPTAPAALWGLGGFSAIIYATVVVALGGLLVWAARQRAPAGDPMVGCVLLVLAALILNAAICGALSGAHPRYQSRVVWLVPLLAAGLLLRPATAAHGSSPRARASSSLISASSPRNAVSRRRAVGDRARSAGVARVGRGRAGAGAAAAGDSSPTARVRRPRSSFWAPLIV